MFACHKGSTAHPRQGLEEGGCTNRRSAKPPIATEERIGYNSEKPAPAGQKPAGAAHCFTGKALDTQACKGETCALLMR